MTVSENRMGRSRYTEFMTLPRMGEIAEHGLVEQLVPHPTVEALHEAVLHWLSPSRDHALHDPARQWDAM